MGAISTGLLVLIAVIVVVLILATITLSRLFKKCEQGKALIVSKMRKVDVTFTGTVETDGTAWNLTVTSNSGNVIFNNTVGVLSPLGEVQIGTSGDVALNATFVSVGSLDITGNAVTLVDVDTAAAAVGDLTVTHSGTLSLGNASLARSRQTPQNRPAEENGIRAERQGLDHIRPPAYAAVNQHLRPAIDGGGDRWQRVERGHGAIELAASMIGDHDRASARVNCPHRVGGVQDSLQDDWQR